MESYFSKFGDFAEDYRGSIAIAMVTTSSAFIAAIIDVLFYDGNSVAIVFFLLFMHFFWLWLIYHAKYRCGDEREEENDWSG